MPKNSSQLKKRLKAANKRRQNRATTAGQSPQSSGLQNTPKVDVLTLMVQATVDFANENRGIQDRVVISALRAAEKGARANGDESAQLLDKYESIRQRDDVSVRAFHSALRHLGDLANQQRASIPDSEESDSMFLDFLSVMT